MNLLFLDFESYLDKASGYDLRKLSIPEYVRDERFKIHGYGYAYGDMDINWDTWPLVQEDVEEQIIVAHNIKFDGFILTQKYGVKPKAWIDTKAMAKAVLGRRVEDYSLRTLAKYFRLPEKGEMKTDGVRDLSPEQKKELAEYCNHDVWLCREIYKRLAPAFPESQYAVMSQTIDMFVNPQLVLDVALLEETAKKEKEDKAKMFAEIGIDKKIFSSNLKFAKLLEEKGYEVPYKTSAKTGKRIPALALGDPAFLDLLESEDEELRRLCEARKESKSTLMETRSEKLAKIGKTGQWPFDVEFSGAVQTHRFSGGGGAGGNPQNFTRDSALRQAVRATDGKQLVVGDFSQIEARIVATLSQDPGLLEAFRGDPYCAFASSFFGRKVTKEDTEARRFGKTAILGLGYGCGASKFQTMVRLQTGKKITEEEAKKAVSLYRAMYVNVPALWRRLDRLIPGMVLPSEFGDASYVSGLPVGFITNGIVLPSGLKIQYPNLRLAGKNRFDDPEWVYDAWGKKGEKIESKLYGGKCCENICQALAGEITKEVMVKFGNKVVGQNHDELILVSDNPIEDRAELEAAMSQPPKWLPSLKLEAEVKIGRNWAESK